MHLIVSNSRNLDRDLHALRRTLAEVDSLAEALLTDAPAREHSALDLHAFLSGQESAIRRRVGARVTVGLRLFAIGAAVVAHPHELEEILFRLVDAADEFMPTGGDLTIGTGWIDGIFADGPLEIRRPRRYVRLTVGDTGSGPNDETWQRILTPIGVEASENIAMAVRRLRGHLLLEHADGEGSRVHVFLPALES